MRKNERKPWDVFTCVECEKCGEYYEADREHICKKVNSYPLKIAEVKEKENG